MCHGVEEEEEKENARKNLNNNSNNQSSTSKMKMKTKTKKERQIDSQTYCGKKADKPCDESEITCFCCFFCFASQRSNTFWYSNMMLRSAFGFSNLLLLLLIWLLHAVYIGLCGLQYSVSLALPLFHAA